MMLTEKYWNGISMFRYNNPLYYVIIHFKVVYKCYDLSLVASSIYYQLYL